MISSSVGTNPHADQPTSLLALGNSLWSNRWLIAQMTKREGIGRHRGSVMELAWSVFNPILMLVIYTFVFSVVSKARWNVGSDSRTEFAMALFSGHIAFDLFVECFNQTPNLVFPKGRQAARAHP